MTDRIEPENCGPDTASPAVQPVGGAHSAAPSNWLGFIYRRRDLLVVAVCLAVMDGIHLVLSASNSLLDIDESGYTLFALIEAKALRHGGPLAWLQDVHLFASQAPVVPALNSLLVAIFGPSQETFDILPLVSHIVIATAVVVLLRYFIDSTPLRVLAALAVALLPGLVWFGQVRIFAEEGAAFLTLALVLVINGCLGAKPRKVFAAFVTLGLAIASRSMIIGLVPSFLVAYCVLELSKGSGSLREYAHLLGKTFAKALLGTGLAISVSVLLYWQQTGAVVRYLLGYGYGAASYNYSSGSSNVFSLSHLVSFLTYQGANELFVVPSVMILIGSFVTLFWVLRQKGLVLPQRSDTRDALRRSWYTLVALAGFSGSALVALVSTRNIGFGFLVPILPELGLLAIGSLSLPRYRYRKSVVAIAAVAIFVSGFPLELDHNFSTQWTLGVQVVGLGFMPVLKEESLNVPYFQQDQVSRPSTETAWKKTLPKIATQLSHDLKIHGASYLIFGAQDHVVNVNSIDLAAFEHNDQLPSVVLPAVNSKRTVCKLEAGSQPSCHAELSTNVQAYVRSLSLPQGHRVLFVVFGPSQGIFTPAPSTRVQLQVAAALGATYVANSFKLPNGSWIKIMAPPF